MTHLGDITKIDWFHVPPADVVTGGSPCQDLSVAGKRAGLAGERSGLYMEQIRCVKELRQADEQRGRTGIAIRPRYMVWENVPGAFSSNGGEDFRAVLEEAAKIAQPDAVISRPPNGKWTNSGAIVGDGWSIAWRVHDAQFWGVAQRRRRISVVCDFGGLSAPEVLFERKGLSGDFEPGGTTREETAGGAGKSTESASGAFNPWDSQSARVYSQDGVWHSLNANENGGQSRDSVLAISFQERAGKPGGGKGILIQNERTGALSTLNNQSVFCAGFSYGQSAKASSVGYQEERSPTLRSGEGGNQKPCVYDARGNGDGKTVCTLTGDHQDRVTDYTALVLNDQGGSVMDVSEEQTATLRAQSHGHEPVVVSIGNGQLNQVSMAEQANTLDTMHDQQAVMCYWLEPGAAQRLNPEGRIAKELCPTLRANAGDNQVSVSTGSVVRRLTPLECERLQGYPDGWTDIGEWVDSKGKRHKDADSPRYKALGNSIALPFWFWLLRRISAQYIGPATLGSLFDGIGGFPLCWERCNGNGTALWASEIEEFPMAVTRRHFGEEETT